MIDRLKTSWRDPSKRPMLMLGFGAVGIAAVLLLVALTQLFGPNTASAPVPTPSPTCIGPNCPVPQSKPLVPQKLFVRDRVFEVTPVAVPKGVWKPTVSNGNVEWVYGTLINYLIGLPNSTENKDLLQALSAADKISLELSDGQTVDFTFGAQQQVPPDSKDTFSQQHPGLTLILLGQEGEQRLVVTADYDVNGEQNRTVPSSVVAINTPVEIGPVRVKVLSGRLVENAPGIPVGSAFYLVDFTVENISEDAVNVSDFVYELLDYARAKYKMSETASNLGPYPAPSGQLLPGISATFTVGFEVPSNITGPVLTWVFKPTAKFNGQANVAVPLIGPTPTPDPRSQLNVQISQAYYTPDQSQIIIVGSINNPTTALVPVGTADIVLSTPEGVLATFISAEPGLPWRIAPNDTLNFTLTFSRLPSNAAILKVLDRSFELTLQ